MKMGKTLICLAFRENQSFLCLRYGMTKMVITGWIHFLEFLQATLKFGMEIDCINIRSKQISF